MALGVVLGQGLIVRQRVFRVTAGRALPALLGGVAGGTLRNPRRRFQTAGAELHKTPPATQGSQALLPGGGARQHSFRNMLRRDLEAAVSDSLAQRFHLLLPDVGNGVELRL